MRRPDRPRIIAPPPLLYAGGFAAALALRGRWPIPILEHPVIPWAGVAALFLGLALNLWGVYSMIRSGTSLNPYRPTITIVTSGPFRLSRNPLYMGLNLIFLGLTLVMNTVWGLVLLVLVLLVMHYGVILPEERYLEGKFGDTYRVYRARVRRYL